MKLELNRREIRRIIQALLLAENYQWSSIDAYMTEPVIRSGIVMRSFPKDKEIISLISRWKRDMEAFKKIREKLRGRIVKNEKT